jgi:alcohol dehydrogenase
MLTPVPDGAAPASLIGLADMATDAWRAVAPQLSRHPEARVLVIGGMPPVIGLYAAGLAVALGAPLVAYLDDDAGRRAVAAAYGAALVSDDVAEQTYDIVVVANPARVSLELAFQVVAPGGVITSVAPSLGGGPELDTPSLYHRGVTWIIGRPDCRHAHDGALSSWANCGFCPDSVPTLKVDWDDAPQAWSSGALYVAAVRPECA